MNKIYDAQIRAVLDRLYKTTLATVPWADMYIWFGTQKISKTPYRHFQKEWEEVCEAHQSVWPDRTKTPALHMIKTTGVHALVIRRELFKDEEAVSFEDLIA